MLRLAGSRLKLWTCCLPADERRLLPGTSSLPAVASCHTVMLTCAACRTPRMRSPSNAVQQNGGSANCRLDACCSSTTQHSHGERTLAAQWAQHSPGSVPSNPAAGWSWLCSSPSSASASNMESKAPCTTRARSRPRRGTCLRFPGAVQLHPFKATKLLLYTIIYWIKTQSPRGWPPT